MGRAPSLRRHLNFPDILSLWVFFASRRIKKPFRHPKFQKAISASVFWDDLAILGILRLFRHSNPIQAFPAFRHLNPG